MLDINYRELEVEDIISRNFLTCLAVLNKHMKVDCDIDTALKMFEKRKEQQTVTLVAMHGDLVVGTASVSPDYKYNHHGKCALRIEDVAVLPEYQGQNIGYTLIHFCKNTINRFNAYKIILNCTEHNVPFYEKCGFYRHELEMRYDICQ